jgi:hypothetical protein
MTRLVLALSILLVLPATAHAGGFTTVGLDPPAGVSAGDQWNATMTILQHGRTPLDGQTPVLTITNGKTSKDFKAVPAGEPGVYRATVVFPSNGRWDVAVDHGWNVVHHFAPVDVGGATPAAAASGGGGDDDPAWLPAIGVALAAGLLAAVITAGVRRRRLVPTP